MRIVRVSRAAFPLLCFVSFCAGIDAADLRGIQFIGLTDFSKFARSQEPRETIFLSPEIVARLRWNELIASWNAKLASNAWLEISVRAIKDNCATKFYSMGIWSGDPVQNQRESVVNQKDGDGDVDTDTLILNKPHERFQLRFRFGGLAANESKLDFVGICVTDTKASQETLKPNRAAWGKSLPVIERSQMAYPNGGVLCSPTTVSMLLNYWSEKLARADLNRDVPEIVREVYDPNWHGTGNWAFNMAYPGSLTGIRAYVTRLSDVSELEDWIASGVPVGLSVCYNKLRGKTNAPVSGHLVVCVGFTKDGDAVINDPGTRQNVRKTFPRRDLIAGWRHSNNTVYLIYPEHTKVPDDRFGHWDSKRARKLLDFGCSAKDLETAFAE